MNVIGNAFNRTLWGKIVLTVIFLFFTTAPVTMFIALKIYSDSFREAVVEQQRLAVSGLATTIDQGIATNQRALKSVAAHVTPSMIANPLAAEHFLDERPALLELFSNGLFLFTPQGKIIAETGIEPARTGLDLSYREYIQKTLASGQPYISSPFISTRPHHHIVIIMTVPVTDAGGTLIAILGGSLDLTQDSLLANLATTRIGEAGYFFLVSADGQVVMHPDRAKILTKYRWPLIDPQGVTPLESGRMAGETTTSDGESQLVAFQRLKTANWFLAATYPTVEAYRPLRQAESQVWFLVVCFGLVITGSLWAMMKYLTGPLVRMTRTISEMEDDADFKPLMLKTGDEIQSLADAFDRMMLILYARKTELEKNRALFQTMSDFATDWIFWRMPDGTMAYSSPACETITGYTPAEIIQDPEQVNKMIHEEDRSLWREHASRRHDANCESEGESMHLEFRIITKQGEIKWLGHTCRSIFGQNGEFLGVRGTNSDITEKKMAELALYEAMQRVEAASVAKGRFLANMSHEIRTPMNGIAGVAQLLATTDLTEEQREYIDIIMKSASSLTTLINDILDLSKVEAGKLKLANVKLNLHDVVVGVCSLLKPVADAKGITLSYQLLTDLPELVTGDPVRLRQVLLNLVNNAVKFTLKGSVRVRVARCENGGDPKKVTVEFAVSDTGIGISREDQSALFRSFSQIDSSLTREFGGTGLGLSIARHLVQLMGGTIGVESEPGQGSIFKFRIQFLPWSGTESADVSRGDSGDTAVAAADARFSSLRVLIVEDNRINQTIVKRMLSRFFHCDADVALNGREAVKMITEHPYDLVFMDVQMPVMDGFEATRIIREMEAATGRRTAIVAMTANAMTGDRERCLEAGMDDYISKPVSKSALAVVMTQVAGGVPTDGFR
jgi:PAS domain S-box-containing protein